VTIVVLGSRELVPSEQKGSFHPVFYLHLQSSDMCYTGGKAQALTLYNFVVCVLDSITVLVLAGLLVYSTIDHPFPGTDRLHHRAGSGTRPCDLLNPKQHSCTRWKLRVQEEGRQGVVPVFGEGTFGVV
jgi:hypothetical protein